MVPDSQYMLLENITDYMEQNGGITGGHLRRSRRYIEILLDTLERTDLYREEIDSLRKLHAPSDSLPGDADSWDRERFLNSCHFHDLGKFYIPDRILYKPGKLTEAEFEEMKTHTLSGIEIIEEIEKTEEIEKIEKTGKIGKPGKKQKADTFLAHAKIFIGTHHEWWDGSGYPFGLKGKGIPLQGRMMAIADVYDALISNRPYKKAYPHKEAVRIIAEGRATHFDPALTELFLGCHDRFFEASVN